MWLSSVASNRVFGGVRQESDEIGLSAYIELRNFRAIGCRNRFLELYGWEPTGSESACHSRNVRTLVDAGHIIAHRDGAGRTITHVKLSDTGLALLRESQTA